MSDVRTVIHEIEAVVDDGIKDNYLDTGKLKPLLESYVTDHCQELAFTSPETIKHSQAVLGRAIIAHARQNSPVYKDKIDAEWLKDLDCLHKTAKSFSVSKSDLVDKKSWYTGTFDAFDNQTSGSTGPPFSYRIWQDIYEPVERGRHYSMILKEFGIDKPKVLYVEGGMPVEYKTVKYGMATIRIAEKQNIYSDVAKLICSHGDENSDYAHIAFDSDAYLHVYDYCRFITDYIQKHKVNVLMASGGFFELLTTFLISDDSALFPKLVDLVSNTGDRVSRETLAFLTETGVAKNHCDHMRCWDGGVSWFTCSAGTTHTQDELAYVYSDSEGRMGSIDFLSYPSPFVNYLNGDYCMTSADFEKCDCGRWHRPFTFHNRRPRQYQNTNGGHYTADDVVRSLLGKYQLGFFSLQDGRVSIEDSLLSDEDKKGITAELAKIYVMVHFFKNPALTKNVLRALSYTPCDPHDYACVCAGCAKGNFFCVEIESPTPQGSPTWECQPR